MRKILSRKILCNWLGIIAIVIQAFMPVWQANAETGDFRKDSLGFAEICYALAETAGAVTDDGEPLSKSKITGHCLLCQLPSFGSVLPEVVYFVPVPSERDIVRYFPAEQRVWSQANRDDRPPTRAPPA